MNIPPPSHSSPPTYVGEEGIGRGGHFGHLNFEFV